MTTSDSSVSGVRVSLCNADLWQKFYPHNEMLVTTEGRKLFPEFKFEIEGLVPDTLYTLSLHLGKVDNHKYAFKAGKWKENGPAGDAYSNEKRMQRNGGRMGADWMNSPVSFSDIYITANPNFGKIKSEDFIRVKPLRKYQPVITVRRMDNGSEEEFRLTMTEFLTVTNYRNPTILELKKRNNKRCNRFFPRGENDEQSDKSAPRGMKRANTSDTTQTAQSSTVASSNGNSATVFPPTKIATLSSTGGLNKFQVPMVAPPTFPLTPLIMLLPPPMALTTKFPPFSALAGVLSNMIIPPVPNMTLNPQYNPFGMRNMPQMGVAPTPPPTQWNLLPGASHFLNCSQVGNPGNMQQLNFKSPQNTNFDRAGPSTQ